MQPFNNFTVTSIKDQFPVPISSCSPSTSIKVTMPIKTEVEKSIETPEVLEDQLSLSELSSNQEEHGRTRDDDHFFDLGPPASQLLHSDKYSYHDYPFSTVSSASLHIEEEDDAGEAEPSWVSIPGFQNNFQFMEELGEENHGKIENTYEYDFYDYDNFYTNIDLLQLESHCENRHDNKNEMLKIPPDLNLLTIDDSRKEIVLKMISLLSILGSLSSKAYSTLENVMFEIETDLAGGDLSVNVDKASSQSHNYISHQHHSCFQSFIDYFAKFHSLACQMLDLHCENFQQRVQDHRAYSKAAIQLKLLNMKKQKLEVSSKCIIL